MAKPNYKFEGMTMAITKMDEMLAFYSSVFKIDFVEKDMYNSKLYSGEWGGMKLLFCPAEIARNEAKQNRHQFDILVNDIRETVKIAIKNHGKPMSEIQEDNTSWCVGIYDPDNNSILFRQRKELK